MVTAARKKQLLSGAFLSSPTKQLKAGLQDLHKLLEAKKQDDKSDRAALKKIAKGLVCAKVASHKNVDVTWLAACCLADIIRVFAPDHPFTDKELMTAFDLFLSKLRALDDHSGEHGRYLLRRLAEVKAFVLLLDDEERTGHLFEIIFALATDLGADEVPYLLAIMIACVQEMDEPNVHMLMYLLDSLVQPGDSTVGACGRELVVRCASYLEDSVTQLLVGVIQDELEGQRGGAAADERWAWEDEYHAVIETIHSISPGMLVHLLPKLADQLKMPDAVVRSKAVGCLARIFSSDCSNAATSYRSLFVDFLDRFNDHEAAIRFQMVEAAPLISLRSDAIERICDLLELRLRDQNEDVRSKAVLSACSIAKTQPDGVTHSLMNGVSLRIRDKNRNIMMHAVAELAAVYASLNSQWGLHWDDDENVEKFGWIPNEVLAGYLQPDYLLRSMVDEVFDTVLLPADVAEEERAEYLLHIYFALAADGQKIFFGMLRDKQRFRSELLAWAGAMAPGSKRTSAKMSMDSEAPEVIAKYKAMVRFFPGLGDEAHAMQCLRSVDVKLLDLLRQLASTSTYADIREHKNEACRILNNAKHKKQGEELAFLQSLVRKAAMSILPEEFFDVLLSYITKPPSDATDRKSLQALVLELAAVCPSAFRSKSSSLWTLMGSSSPSVVRMALTIISAPGSGIKANQSQLKQLKQLCTGTVRDLAALAARGLCTMADVTPKVVVSATDMCVDALKDDEDAPATSQISALMALSEIATHKPEAFTTVGFEVFEWGQSWLENVKAVGSKVEIPIGLVDSSALIYESFCAVLAAWLVHTGDSGTLPNTEALDMMYGVLKKKGKLVDSYSGVESSVVRTASYVGILKLASKQTIDWAIPFERFLALSAMAEDPSVSVRTEVLDTLSGLLHKLKLPLRYVAHLVLFEVDTNRDLRSKAKKSLSSIVQQRRTLLSSSAVPQEKKTVLLPEYAAFYVTHTLGHLRALRSDAPRFIQTAQLLRFFLEPLLHQDASHSFLLRVFEQIKQSRDKVATKGVLGMHVVAELGELIIRDKIKGKKWHPHSVAIPLPRQIMEARSSSKSKTYLPAAFKLPKASASVRGDGAFSPHKAAPVKKRAREEPAAAPKASNKRRKVKEAEGEQSESPAPAAAPVPARRSSRAGARRTKEKIARSLAPDMMDAEEEEGKGTKREELGASPVEDDEAEEEEEEEEEKEGAAEEEASTPPAEAEAEKEAEPDSQEPDVLNSSSHRRRLRRRR
eukprot:TRINITY_DN4994_c1_g1_i2.p1 TRINITY_DN4994_c1_g1~~TRINITY_DN4994_c1_g1_i2.p1  ORF type:complete len:1269 (+),score=402.30 TRINITY_DN4994_c1_g1_i2:55-3807(+)